MCWDGEEECVCKYIVAFFWREGRWVWKPDLSFEDEGKAHFVS